jgi:anti-sigma B factor antagonist
VGEGLTLDVAVAGDRASVAVGGAVDVSTAAEVHERLVALVSEGVRHVVVDLEGTAYLDASGVDVFVRAFKLLSALGGTFSVVCPHPHLAKLFTISALADALSVQATRADAPAVARPGGRRSSLGP